MQTLALVAGLVAVLAITAVLESMRHRRAENREHARERQAWEAERARLVDQVCNLAGKPWTPPPSTMRTAAPTREPIPDLDLAEF